MDFVGRMGWVEWAPDVNYRARVVSYNGATGLHKVCWLDDYTFSIMRLARVGFINGEVFWFRPASTGPSAALAGRRILLEPTCRDFLSRHAMNPERRGEIPDFRACVICRAEDSPPRTYYVYYIAYNMIVTADLSKVRFSLLNRDDEVVEVRNCNAPLIELDPPLFTPFAYHYIRA